MARTELWAQVASMEIAGFVDKMHNKGISLMELARVFSRLDEDEPEDEADLLAKVQEELLS